MRARITALALLALCGSVLPAGAAAAARHPGTARAATTCPGLKRMTGQHAWFDVARAGSRLARNWQAAICSAADGSTIDLALWFIGTDGPDTTALIDDLKLMHDDHHVRVNVLVGRSEYAPGPTYVKGLSFAQTSTALSFAHLMTCYYGCRSSLKQAITHSKFMTISQTRAGQPAVLESSANWTAEQFEDTRQSAIFFGGDVPLYRAFRQRFASMAACATGSCRDDKADPVRHRKGVKRVWYDADGKTWRGVAQGAAVYFDPLPHADDPVAHTLSTLRCQGRGTVDVMSLWLTRPAVIKQLRRLRREGCRLNILVEHPLGPQKQVHDLGEMCVGLTHDKMIAVNTGSTTLVIAGSEDWTSQSGWTHDQQVVADSHPSIYRAYAGYYTAAARGAVPCVSSGKGFSAAQAHPSLDQAEAS